MYDQNIISIAGKIFHPDIYEILLSGKKLDTVIIPPIANFDCNRLFKLIGFIYETVR
jgi:hypothetical protein